MPTYKCNNKTCSSFGEHAFISKTKLVSRDGVFVDIKASCPECSKTRETVKTDGFTTFIHGGPNVPI